MVYENHSEVAYRKNSFSKKEQLAIDCALAEIRFAQADAAARRASDRLTEAVKAYEGCVG